MGQYVRTVSLHKVTSEPPPLELLSAEEEIALVRTHWHVVVLL